MSTMRSFRWIGVVYLLAAGQVYAQATFTPLGRFGAFDSVAHDVSADGSVVVGVVTNFPDRTHGVFRWTKEGSSIYSETVRSKVAVSDDGTTIVGSRYLPQTNRDEAFRWIPDEGLFEGLGDSLGGVAYDVSADGSVIVGYGNANNQNGAFRWTETGGMVHIGPGTAYGVSSDGSVIVGSSAGAFRWTAETGMVTLPSLPGAVGSVAFGVSPDGTVVVGAQEFRAGLTLIRSEASRWTEQEGTVSLALNSWTLAVDVSADGLAAVGGGLGRSTGATAFYWTPQIGFAELQDILVFGGATGIDGWRLTSATGISHDGRTVVGSGFDPSGQLTAFVATIGAVPEPSTFVLAGFAAAGLIGLLFQRQRRCTPKLERSHPAPAGILWRCRVAAPAVHIV
jgi:probable HAF family extracellular repeat protein